MATAQLHPQVDHEFSKHPLFPSQDHNQHSSLDLLLYSCSNVLQASGCPELDGRSVYSNSTNSGATFLLIRTAYTSALQNGPLSAELAPLHNVSKLHSNLRKDSQPPQHSPHIRSPANIPVHRQPRPRNSNHKHEEEEIKRFCELHLEEAGEG